MKAQTKKAISQLSPMFTQLNSGGQLLFAISPTNQTCSLSENTTF